MKKTSESVGYSVPGLNDALCAYSFFRQRHVLKDPEKTKAVRRGPRASSKIRNVAASARMRTMTRNYIKSARLAGWKGSFIQAVLNSHSQAEK